MNSTGDYRVYTAPDLVESLAFLPRLGHTRDITVVFAGDAEEIADYVLGLIFSGAFALAVFAAWGAVLCVLMCLGPRRVGFLSGRHPPLVVASPELGGRKSHHHLGKLPASNGTTLTRRLCRRHTMTRIAFLFAGTIFILASILMMTEGLLNVQDTLSTFHQSAGTVHDIVAEIENIHEENLVGMTDENTANLRDVLVEEFGDSGKFCPGDPALENSEGAREAAEKAREAASLLGDLGSFLSEETAPALELAGRVRSASVRVQDATDVTLTDWKALVVLVPCIALPSFLMYVTVLRLLGYARSDYDCMINWVIVPLFVVLVAAACVGQGVISIGAGMNADFCLQQTSATAGYNSPDETVMAIVEGTGFDPDSYVYIGIDWYVTQCRSDNPFQPIIDYKPIAEAAQQTLEQAGESIFEDAEFMQGLSQACGREFGSLEEPVEQMKEIVSKLNDTTERFLELFSCDNIVDLYTATIYDGTCTYSVEGGFWIYCCTVIMGFFGMLMLTLRASYKLTEAPPEDQLDDVRRDRTIIVEDSEDHDEGWEALPELDGTEVVYKYHDRNSANCSIRSRQSPTPSP